MQHYTLCLVALTEDCSICVLKTGKLLSVTLTLALEFFGNPLLQNKRLEGVVALLLRAR